MKVFTIRNGVIYDGATVGRLSIKGAGMEIPAIIIGEEGRGRLLGVLPVKLTSSQEKEWGKNGTVKIFHAKVGETRAGKAKLFSEEDSSGNNEVIIVLRTEIGFRGSNVHTGDLDGDQFLPFPGKIIVQGVIAQGDAGRMGSGDQFVAVISKGSVFRTGYSGRLYGNPPEHYYVWNGKKVIACTLEERNLTEAF